MKKLLFIVLLVSTMCSPVFADNSERITELTAEFKSLQTKQAEYTQALQTIILRQAQIQGIVTELENQDKAQEKVEEPK